MRPFLILTAAVLLVLGAANAAEVYRWVDKDGKVHYSDSPPPPAVKDAELKKLGGNAIQVDKESYATRDATKRNPVTLYANNCGIPCDSARQLLSKRGIPFATKNPESSPADAEALKKLTGAMEVPILVIGKDSPLKGFEAGSWDAALDAAGYSRTPVIAPRPATKSQSDAKAQPSTPEKAPEKTDDKAATPKQ